MHLSKISALLCLLAVEVSHGFVAPKIAFRNDVDSLSAQRSQKLDSEFGEQVLSVPRMLQSTGPAVVAAALLAFGPMENAMAVSGPLPAGQETMQVSSPSTASLRESLHTSRPNALSPRQLIESSYLESDALGSSSFITAAVSSNVANGGSSAIQILDINYNGEVPTSQSDEYVVVKNTSKDAVDISKFYIYVATTGTQGPTFYFPKDSVLQPGKTVRVYTNEIHKETGGYSFGVKKAIWNDKGGLAVLKDKNDKKIMEFKYKGA